VNQWNTNTIGLVTFPDGPSVRARGLRRGEPSGEQPDFGVYLLTSSPPPQAWESRWIEWPDFRLPRHHDEALEALADARLRASSCRVEIACSGGRGRTGTALAAMAVMSGVAPSDAVDWVRVHYHPKAVETPWQRRWVERLT
jgi:protein-tyrosine phosphatase